MDSMEEIYMKHAKIVYRFLLSRTMNEELSEELTQETFYQAVQSIYRFKGESSITTWLCGIAKNVWKFRLIGDLSYREIGEIMGKTENWARVNYYRGKERIMKEVRRNEKNRDCALVSDLLPLYLEELTSQETNIFIKEHMKQCRECEELYKNMKDDLGEGQGTEVFSGTETNEKEIDYLKKVKKKTNHKVMLGIGGVVVLGILAILVKLFVYGTPVKVYDADVTVEDGIVNVKGNIDEPYLAFSRAQIQKINGENKLVLYATNSSIFNSSNFYDVSLGIEEAKENGLTVGNQKVLEDGTIISNLAVDIYKKRHMYIGDMSKNSSLARAVGIRKEFGEFTNELQTDDEGKEYESHRWILHFKSVVEENEDVFNDKMRCYAYILLATEII